MYTTIDMSICLCPVIDYGTFRQKNPAHREYEAASLLPAGIEAFFAAERGKHQDFLTELAIQSE